LSYVYVPTFGTKLKKKSRMGGPRRGEGLMSRNNKRKSRTKESCIEFCGTLYKTLRAANQSFRDKKGKEVQKWVFEIQIQAGNFLNIGSRAQPNLHGRPTAWNWGETRPLRKGRSKRKKKSIVSRRNLSSGL